MTTQNNNNEFVNQYIKTMKEKLDGAVGEIVLLESKLVLLEEKFKQVVEEKENLNKENEKLKETKKTNRKTSSSS